MMRKQILFLLFGAILVQLTACNKTIRGSGHIVQQTLSVDSFAAIEINGGFDVYLQQSSIPTDVLLMEADDNIVPLIEVRVVNRVLKIRYTVIENIRTRKTPRIFLNTAYLTRLFINGSGTIQTGGVWKGNELELRVNGSGDIDIHQQVQVLNASVNGSGSIRITGKSALADYYISGSGNINGSGLICEKAQLVLSGSGTMYCGVEKELDASVSGSGKIYYSGNPGIVRTQISGNGQIIRQ